MSTHRKRLGPSACALACQLAVPAALAIAGLGCGATTSLDTGAVDVQERDATAAALVDQLSVEGALLDDTGPIAVLSSSSERSSSPRIAEIRSPIPRPLDKLLRAWGAVVPASCATVEESGTDADGDGIPSASAVRFDCSSATYAVTGSAYVLDDNDGDPTSGFSVGMRGLRVHTAAAATAADVTRTIDGSFLVFVRPDPAPGTLDIKIDARLALARGPTDSASLVELTWSGVTTYVPDASLTASSRSLVGSVTSTATTKVAYLGGTRPWTRSATPALHWNLACKAARSDVPGFDGGGALYADDIGNTLQIDFGSCSTWTITPNG